MIDGGSWARSVSRQQRLDRLDGRCGRQIERLAQHPLARVLMTRENKFSTCPGADLVRTGAGGTGAQIHLRALKLPARAEKGRPIIKS
jgi:hypothetical protein